MKKVIGQPEVSASFDLLKYAHQTALESQDQTIKTWLELNQIAEPSWGEKRTADYVRKRAKDLGIEVIQLENSHTLVLRIIGSGTGENAGTIAYKVDLDALGFKNNAGVTEYLHACFHSGHLAIALEVAKAVNRQKHRFNSTFLVIAQTAEEQPNSGGQEFTQSELFKQLKIDRMIALHASPELRAGQVGFHEGQAQAGIDILHFEIEVDTNKIKSQHPARPQAGTNPIWASMKLALGIQQNLAETVDPVKPYLFNIVQNGSDNFGDENVNIVPIKSTFVVNFRVFDLALKQEIFKKIDRLSRALELEYEGFLKVSLRVDAGPLPVYNDPELTRRVKSYAEVVLGNDQVFDVPQRMGGDDISFYSHILPVIIFRLGTGNPEKGITADLHKKNFTVDTDCFETGISVMVYTALQELGVQ